MSLLRLLAPALLSPLHQAANETVRAVRITVIIEGDVTGPDGALLPVSQTYRYGFQDGTGQNQLGSVRQDLDGSLATTSTTMDLDGVTDFTGATMSDTNNVKFMCIKHESDAGELVIGGGDFATWVSDPTDKIKIKPRGLFLLVAPLDGYAVTASTGDVLAIESTGGTVAYKTIVGTDNT